MQKNTNRFTRKQILTRIYILQNQIEVVKKKKVAQLVKPINCCELVKPINQSTAAVNTLSI